jgi:hypothetical protein
MAQQGQFHVLYLPFHLARLKSTDGLATYAPISYIDRATIQLREDDGTRFSFTLDENTIFCQGGIRVPDWTYLKKANKKLIITVLTNDDKDSTALVVWDRGPTFSSTDGDLEFNFPPLCK